MYSTKILKSAIAVLPNVKNYPVEEIRIRIEKTDVWFKKKNNEWYLKEKAA